CSACSCYSPHVFVDLLCPLLFPFCLSCSAAPRDLHSFPTRRSSDLVDADNAILTSQIALPQEESAGVYELEEYAGSAEVLGRTGDRKSTRLNSSHVSISYAVFCLKKKKNIEELGNKLHIEHECHSTS